jgi:glycosyltransferase involved in cell wall biosynthesis
MSDDLDILIVIPAYNEEIAIRKTLEELIDVRKSWSFSHRILVINDGSTDGTASVAESLDIEVINLQGNIGIAQVFQLACSFAKALNAKCLLILDADNQHPVQSIPNLFDACDENTYVIGSRDFDYYPISKVRRNAIKILNVLIYLKTKTKVVDSTSGFRVIGKNVLLEIDEIQLLDNYLEDTILTLFIVSKSGYCVREVNVLMQNRKDGKPSTEGVGLVLKFLSIFTLIAFS